MLEKLLGGRDRQCLCAGTGFEALDAIRSQRPDLIILDFFLPDMVALSFMIEARKLCPMVPIVIVSSFWNMGYAKLAVNEGAADFIPKPIDMQQLMEVVNLRLAE